MVLIIASGCYVGWNIGANDTANCVGTAVGAGLLSFRKAVVLVALFVFLGALLEGDQVMKTIGKGIVKTDLPVAAVVTILLCSGFWVSIATFYRVPVSTSQAIVGGVVGAGLAAGAEVNYGKLLSILQSWLISPLAALVFALVLCHLLNTLLRRIKAEGLLVRNAIGRMTIFSGCYMAYTMGANNVGNAVGPIANLSIFSNMTLLAIGGVAIAIGALTYGKKVSETVGKNITSLDAVGAFSAQAAAAASLHLFTIYGIPVSTSAAIVGAVIGVGLTRGARAVKGGTILTIALGWALTPTLAALTSFLVYTSVMTFF